MVDACFISVRGMIQKLLTYSLANTLLVMSGFSVPNHYLVTRWNFTTITLNGEAFLSRIVSN